jgi:hypothetical protein
MCHGLTNVTIPDSVSIIGLGVFQSSGLTSVTIPNSVIDLGGWAFAQCYYLTSITIPDSVTNITQGVFLNCTSLTNITIPTSVTSIGDSVFGGCYTLTSITIPNSVTNIGDYAFMACAGLMGVYFQGNVPTVGSGVFNGPNNATAYYLPGNTGWTPQVQTSGASFGVRTNQFGFTIMGSSGLAVVVEASTNLSNSTWTPVGTNTFADGSSYFTDPQWANYPARFYRLQSATLGGRPTVLWNPRVQTRDSTFGVRTNRFGFTIAGTPNIPLVIEAAANLAGAAWTPLQTCTLTNGSIYFSDPNWTNYPSRFYRLRSPP